MENKRLTTWQVVLKLVSVMKNMLGVVCLAVVFAVLGFVVTVYIPVYIVNIGFDGLNGKTISWFSLFVLILLALLRGLFRYGEHYFGHYVAFKTLADFRMRVFAKLKQLAPAKLDVQDSGALLKMIGEDIEAMEVFFAHTLPPVTTGMIVFGLMMLYFLTLDGVLTVIVGMTYLLLALVIPYVFAYYLEPLLKEQGQTRKTYTSQFLESLKGVRELLQFQKLSVYLERLNAGSKTVNGIEKKVVVQQLVQTSTTFLTIGLAITLFTLRAVVLVQQEKLTVLQTVVGTVVFSSSFAPFLELGRLPLGFKRAINAGRNVFGLLDQAVHIDSGTRKIHDVKTVKMSQVSFRYDTRNSDVLTDVSLDTQSPKIIGIVGASGSGKSTLMKLLMKWYPISTGEITVNNEAIHNIAANDLQRVIAYIPQMPQIFNQTIRENLTLGRDISDEEILQAAQNCHIKDRIMSLENGLDTVISQENAMFSAGEMQRFELTRALLKKADCYIFDEPTSHLDSLNEALLLRTIKTHCRGTVFLISHRPSTVSCADEVYRMEKGILTKV